jgi:hypothetical protein
MFEQCAAGVGDPVRQPLSQRLAGRVTEQHRGPSETLREILQRRCTTGPGTDAGGVDLLVDALMHFFVRTQEILCLGSGVQERINTLLARPQPKRLFTARDVDIHILLQGEEARRLPQLVDELERVLGLRVDITREGVAIAEANEIQA